MMNARTSVLVWGYYLYIIGIGLLIIPNTLMGLLGFATLTEFPIRVVGILVIVLGFYYWSSTQDQALTAFYGLTVIARAGVVMLMILTVSLGYAPWNLLIFAASEALSGLWTFLALRGEGIDVF